MTVRDEVRITVPLVPPSVNHYKMRTRKGVTFVSQESKDFKENMVAAAIGCDAPCLTAKAYEVEAVIYLGFAQKGDADNFAKCLLDSLVYAEVIDSDAKITDLILRKRRDRDNPRTEIVVRALEGK